MENEAGRQHRVRLKLPSGAEFEAEGTPEFITKERREFLALQGPPPAAQPPSAHRLEPEIVDWGAIIETQGGGMQLRAKLTEGTEKDACLVLLAASGAVLREPKPTSTQLARWLRASGYPVARVDRALQEAVERGEILATGSRRARRYELSGPGKVAAVLMAGRLTALVKGPAGR
jgi:hypothetical protein